MDAVACAVVERCSAAERATQTLPESRGTKRKRAEPRSASAAKRPRAGDVTQLGTFHGHSIAPRAAP